MKKTLLLFWCLFGFVAFVLPVDDTITSEYVTSPTDIRDIVATLMGTVWDKVQAVYNDIYDSITVVKRIKSSLPVLEPLLWPIQRGDLGVVRRLVCQRNTDVNRNLINTSELPVERAAQYGQLHVVKLLVEYGAKIDFSERRFTPLHAAARHGHIDVMKYLVSLGAKIDSEDEYGVTPLHHAAYCGGLIAVAYLWALYLEQLDDVQGFLLGREKTHTDDQFNTVLEWAVSGGNLTVVQFLIQQGAALDGRSYPLHIACMYNQAAMVRYFVCLDLDVKREASAGLFWRHERVTPLQAVFSFPKNSRRIWDPLDLFDVIQMLVEHGADVNVKWRSGTTVLHSVCHMAGMHKVVNYLLKKGADPTALNNKGRSPLHYAAHSAQNIRRLVEYGADIHVVDSDGDTPLHDAMHYAFRRPAGRHNHDALVALLQYGADAYKLNNAGMTPLLCLLFGTNPVLENCVRHLLSWGVALNSDEQRRLGERERDLNLAKGAYADFIEETREKVAQDYPVMEKMLLSSARPVFAQGLDAVVPTFYNHATRLRSFGATSRLRPSSFCSHAIAHSATADRTVARVSEGGTSILPDDLQRLLISFVVTRFSSR